MQITVERCRGAIANKPPSVHVSRTRPDDRPNESIINYVLFLNGSCTHDVNMNWFGKFNKPEEQEQQQQKWNE